MTHRDKEQARALEYARSQGWDRAKPDAVPAACSKCEALERGQQVAVDALEEANVALAAERESHAVTKRAVLRGTRARCVALENALEQHVEWMRYREKSKPFDAVERVSVERAEALLK